MADLGFTPDQTAGIQDFWNKNKNDNAALQAGMTQYGVSADQLGSVIGQTGQEVGQYLQSGGAANGFGGYTAPDNPYAGWNAKYGTNLDSSGNAQSGSLSAVAKPYSMSSPASSPAGSSVESAMSGPTMQGYTKNPYLDQMAAGVTQQVGDNWSRNMAPSIRSGAMAAGGFGGSRQGVVEANGMKDANQGLSNSLASLYGNDYNAAMGRNLQQYGQDQSYALGNKQANNSYDLGLRSSDLGFSSLDANINNSNFNNQLNSANFGLGVYNTQQAGNNSAINAGSAINSTPYNNWQNFNQQANSIGQGYGSSTSNGSTSSPGNAAVGALGGWQLGSQFSKSMTPSPSITQAHFNDIDNGRSF